MERWIIFGVISFMLVALPLVSAISITSVYAPSFEPGKEQAISVGIKNDLDSTIEDVSMSLQLQGTSFIAVGSSEDSLSEIRQDKERSLGFTLRSAYDIKPGDYSIPYILTYSIDGVRQPLKQGTIGVSIVSSPELTFALSEKNPVYKGSGSITLQIINRGLADARFVSIRVFPQGFTLRSDEEVYLGTVDSDDFQTATFEVQFTRIDPAFSAVVEYRDLDNRKITRTIDLPIAVYTREQAIAAGIIQPSYWIFYLGAVIFILILFVVWRSIKRRRRLRAQTALN
jgi:hypothetical protein